VAARLSTAKKFSLAYFGLAALVGGAIGTFVMLVQRPAPLPPPPWSVWTPTASDKVMRAQEIGSHVAAEYRLPSGNRLVNVVVGNPAVGDPIEAVAFARTTKPMQQSDVLSVVPANGSMMFVLCGTGPKCAIGEGKASQERGAVVRREALELALYTLRYVKDVDLVVTFFPPTKGSAMSSALFFDRKSFSAQLDSPLHSTLRSRAVAVNLTPSERQTVDLLTRNRALKFALQRESNGARVLVLAPKVG
jgi:hypothetical protein